MKKLLTMLMVAILIIGMVSSCALAKVRIAMVVKNLGNAFFEACRDGGLEAIGLGEDIELIFTGPITPTAEGQIEIIDSLIAQKVDAIAISANDTTALIPVCQGAMAEGIKVISFDSGIAPPGRLINLDPSSPEFIGRQQLQLIAELIGYEGEVAILSATSQATNQNTWIKWMKEEIKKPEYAKMSIVTTVYGDDLSDKSYREAMGLFKSYPNLKGIIAPTSVGIAATGKALEDEGLSGVIELTGLGLPSEMKQYSLNDTCRKFALWNPVDLGYAATTIAYKLVTGEIKGEVGEVMKVGKLGDIPLGEDGMCVVGPPFVFTKDNVEFFAEIF